METERIYDLTKFMKLLPVSQRKLGKALRQWRDGHSTVADLRIAGELVDTAMKQWKTADPETQLLILAAMHASVMGYARAIERKSKHRGKLPVVGKFNDQQTAMHKKIVNLRDEAVGHHGPAGFIRPWHEDKALLFQNGNQWQPAIMSRRSLFEENFASLVATHIKEVIAITEQIVAERQTTFQSAFHAAINQDEVAEALLKAELSKTEIANIPEQALSGPRQGNTIAVWNDPTAFSVDSDSLPTFWLKRQ